jgi:hypothetical protein
MAGSVVDTRPCRGASVDHRVLTQKSMTEKMSFLEVVYYLCGAAIVGGGGCAGGVLRHWMRHQQ